MKYTSFNYRPYEAHTMVLRMIDCGSTVIDMGCATGYFAKELRLKSCFVIGVERDRKAAKLARAYCDRVIIADLNRIGNLDIDKESADYVLLLDVIEHLTDVKNLLKEIKRIIKPKGQLIISTPNIAHISIRLMLVSGNFDYKDVGIMDNTHTHFYTRKSLKRLFADSGWDIKSFEVTADFGQIPQVGRLLRHLPKNVQHGITSLFPGLLGVQWITVLSPKIY